MPAGIGIKKTISNRFIFEEIRTCPNFSFSQIIITAFLILSRARETAKIKGLRKSTLLPPLFSSPALPPLKKEGWGGFKRLNPPQSPFTKGGRREGG